jgi:hypothetical protein
MWRIADVVLCIVIVVMTVGIVLTR